MEADQLERMGWEGRQGRRRETTQHKIRHVLTCTVPADTGEDSTMEPAHGSFRDSDDALRGGEGVNGLCMVSISIIIITLIMTDIFPFLAWVASLLFVYW